MSGVRILKIWAAIIESRLIKFFRITMEVPPPTGGISSGMPHAPARLSCAVVRPPPGACRFTIKQQRFSKQTKYRSNSNTQQNSQKSWQKHCCHSPFQGAGFFPDSQYRGGTGPVE